MQLFTRITPIALGFALVASMGLPAAFAQQNSNGVNPAPNSGQAGWHHHGKRGMHGECKAFADLNLTQDQKNKLKELHKTFREQNAATFEQMKSQRTQLRTLVKNKGDQNQIASLRQTLASEHQEMVEKSRTMMQGVLTPEQMSKFEAAKQQCKMHRHGNNNAGKNAK